MSRLQLPTVHILFENPAWLPPLVEGLKAEGFPTQGHYVDEGVFDPSAAPQSGIWLNRVSPSSHTRGHNRSVAATRELLYWLESNGRRVINGSRAFELEVSKIRQDLALRTHGIKTPKTVLALGEEALISAALSFEGPFITKHNQGGKGLGIRLFEDPDHFRRSVRQGELDEGPSAQVVLQQYIRPAEPFITRVEIAFGRFLFAMRSSTADGFELCPSDACQGVSDSGAGHCPIDGGSKFSPSPLTSDDPLVQQYLAFSAAEDVPVAGIEFVEDERGDRYTYDVNGTTNYSSVLGAQIGVDGMRELARGLASSLEPRNQEHAA